MSIGHISPEAAEGGLIGLLKDGDIITIDVDTYEINANLDEIEIQARQANFTPKIKKVNGSWLKQYRQLVTNASSGAILKTDEE